MKRTSIAFSLAILGAVSLAAQTPTQVPPPTSSAQKPMSADKASDISVTGCLARSADGNYMLTNARIDPAGSASTATAGEAGATATGTSGTTSTATATGTSGTTAATATTPTEPAGSGTANSGSTWALSGGSDLDKHVGHKIQVSGREVKATPPPSETTTSTSTASSAQQKLDVQSVKMIASSCS
jgi:hypothetical protein